MYRNIVSSNMLHARINDFNVIPVRLYNVHSRNHSNARRFRNSKYIIWIELALVTSLLTNWPTCPFAPFSTLYVPFCPSFYNVFAEFSPFIEPYHLRFIGYGVAKLPPGTLPFTIYFFILPPLLTCFKMDQLLRTISRIGFFVISKKVTSDLIWQ